MAGPGGVEIDPRFLPTLSTPEEKKPVRGWFSAGLGSGVDQFQSVLGSTVQGAGMALGMSPVEELGRGIAQRNIAEAAASGRPDLEIAPWREGGANVLPWVGYQATKQLPIIATYLAGGKGYRMAGGKAPRALEDLATSVPRALGGGGLLPGASFAARRAAVEGGARQAGKDLATELAGGSIAGIPIAFGSMVQEADSKPGGATAHDVAKAALLSPVYSALDALQPAAFKGLLQRGQTGNILKRVGMASFLGAASEVPQEGLQTALEMSFRPDLSAGEKFTNIVDAAVTGGAVGGLFGGAGGIRGLKRVDPAEFAQSPEAMEDAVDQALNLQLRLPSPTMYANQQGDIAEGQAGFADLTAPRMQLPGPGDIEGRSAIEGSTMISGRNRDGGRFAPGSSTVEQPPIDSAARSFQGWTTPELTNALNVLSNQQQAGKLKSGFAELIAPIQSELEFRKSSLTEPGVASQPVGAAQPETGRRRGTTDQVSEAPASTNLPWTAQRDDLLRGIATRKWYREAETAEDLDRILVARLEDGSTAKSDLELAKRRGIDVNAPSAPLETAATRTQEQAQKATVETPEPAAPASQEGGDFAAKWKTDVQTTGQKDKGARTLKPTSEADAQRQIYRALGAKAEIGDGLERLAQKYGILDDQKRLTPLAVEIAEREPISTERAIKAARAQGFKGAQASMFDRGVKAQLGGPQVTEFDSREAQEAYVAGSGWAQYTNSVPKGALTKYEPRAVSDTDVGLVEGTVVPQPRTVPPEARASQTANQAIDATRAAFASSEDDVAELKRRVRSGDVDGAMQGLLQVQRGERLFRQPEPGPREPFVGAVAETGALKPKQIENRQLQQAWLRVEQESNASKSLRESNEAIARNAARKEFQNHIQSLVEEVEAELAAESQAPKELRTDRRGNIEPYIVGPDGQMQISPKERLNAAQLISVALNNVDNPQALIDGLIEQGGDLANQARRFGKYLPKGLKVRVWPDYMMADIGKQYGWDSAPWAFHVPEENMVVLSPGIRHPSIIMHEFTHAIIGDHVHRKTAVGRQIINIFNRFEEHGPTDDYAFTSANEFIAEFISRQQVRDYIKELSERPGLKLGNIFDRIWQAIRKALGMPSVDYVEKLFKLAEAAGQNRLGPSKAVPSAMLTNTTAKNVVGQVNGAMGRLGDVTQAGLKALIGAMPLTHIVKQYKQILPAAQQLFDAHADRRASTSVLAHLYDEPKTINDRLSQTPQGRKTIERTHEVMEATAWDINPRVPWEQNEHLHELDNATLLKRKHAEFHRLYNLLKKDGNNQLYDAYASLNEMENFASMAMGIRQLVVSDPTLTAAMPYFNTDPMEVMRNDAQYHNPQAARAYWRKVLDDSISATSGYFDTLRGEGNDSEMARLSPLEMYLRLVKRGVTSMDSAPYFHLGRHGDHFVSAQVRLGTDKKVDGSAVEHVAKELEKIGITDARVTRDLEKPTIFLRLETRAQRDQAAQLFLRLQRQGWLNKDVDVLSAPRDEGQWLPERTKAEMKKFINALEARFEPTDDMSAEEKEASASLKSRVRSIAYDTWLNMLPDGATSKVMTHRESKPGYSKDMGRNFAFRYNIGVNSLANMAAEPYIDNAFEKMRAELNDAKRAASGKDVDAIKTIYGELAQKEANLAAMAGDTSWDKWRALTHSYFLGASPSYFLLNMTQVGVTLWPELAKKHGFMASAKAIGRATSIAIKIMAETAKQGYDIGGALRAADTIITPKVLKAAVGNDVLLSFLQRMIGSSIIDIGSHTREMTSIAEGSDKSTTRDVIRLAAAAGLYSETVTRLIGAIAAYDLHQGSLDSKVDYAKDVVREAFFEYSTYNVPRLMGKMGLFGKFTPVMTQFMQYSTQLTFKLYRELDNSFGKQRPGESAAQQQQRQKEGRRFLMSHLTAVTVLAGTLGLPFATVGAAVLERLVDAWDDDEEPYDASAAWRNYLAETFGPEVAEMIARGVPRGMGEGFDLSQRAGEQDLLPFSQWLTDRREMQDASAEAALRSLGAPVGMAMNIYGGLEKIAAGDMLGGMVQLMPQAMKGPTQSFRMYQDGYKDTLGNKLPMTPKASAYLFQLLGLNPAEKANYSEKRTDQAARKGVLLREANRLRKGIVDALVEGDRETAVELIREAQKFDAANPKFSVLDDIESSIKRRERAQVTARATNNPIGVPLDDPGGQALTRY